jgi:hypothetical protein
MRRRAAARPGEPGAGADDSLRRRRLILEQVAVLAGQLGVGGGNLAFSVVALRLLDPSDFAEMVTFVALYLLLHVPATSLAVGSALAPGSEQWMRRAAFRSGVVAGGALAVASPVLERPLHVSGGVLLVLAAAAPGAGLLGLARGRLFASGHVRGAVASLLVEPAGRLTLGVLLAAVAGAVGGAVGVVVSGYAALAVARRFGTRLSCPAQPSPAAGRPAAVVGVFLLLAVLQNQDLIFANALLGRTAAALFAALTTLGGGVAFMTGTIPLVLLRRAARREAGAVAVALCGAVAIGGGALVLAAAAPAAFWVLLLGSGYAGAGRLAAAYVGAMAMFGIARVLVAHDCATTGGRASLAAVVVATAGQCAGLLAFHDDARSIALVTLSTMTTFALSIAAAYLLGRRTVLPRSRARAGRPAGGSAGGPAGGPA